MVWEGLIRPILLLDCYYSIIVRTIRIKKIVLKLNIEKYLFIICFRPWHPCAIYTWFENVYKDVQERLVKVMLARCTRIKIKNPMTCQTTILITLLNPLWNRARLACRGVTWSYNICKIKHNMNTRVPIDVSYNVQSVVFNCSQAKIQSGFYAIFLNTYIP